MQAAVKDPILDPIIQEANQPQEPEGQFSRNVMWTFEDLRMLIGTDLPIFGGGTHPCLSLRLRYFKTNILKIVPITDFCFRTSSDMSKPINVLTGLDYWLDNLMCKLQKPFKSYEISKTMVFLDR